MSEIGTGSFLRTTAKIWCHLLAITLTLSGCGPTQREKEKFAEEQRQHCRDHLCEGDVLPQYDHKKDALLKLGGVWLIGPEEYFSSGTNGASFFWPSKTPGGRGGDFPERPTVIAGKKQEVVIEIFIRSYAYPTPPYSYQLVQMAEANKWIASRELIRPGLERIRYKHVHGPDGYYLDMGGSADYIATELKGSDGFPPVARCSHYLDSGGGGTGFLWRYGLWVGVRMNQRHCIDWPEIYPEVVRVLDLLHTP